MMVELLIIAFTVVVIAIVVYAISTRDRDLDKKRPNRGAVRQDRRTDSDSSPKEPSVHDGINQRVDDISFSTTGTMDGGTQDLQASIKEGMALTFSGTDLPPEGVAPLLKIDDIRGDVGLRVLSHIATLKNVDSINRLQRMMGDPKTSTTDLSSMITSNPILSAKILQIANSAYYGMEQKLNSISHAIMIIGMVHIKAIVYHEGVLQALNEQSFRNNPAMQSVWQHSNYASIYASYLHYLFGNLNMGTLFTLGLLHDIGKFIMMKLKPLGPGDKKLPTDYSPDRTTVDEDGIYGINHALAGRLAVQNWGLSPLIVQTVGLHHAPAYLPPTDLGLDNEAMQYLLVMFLADQAARLYAAKGGDEARVDRLHPAYHSLIDRNKLSRLMVDKSLMGQLREAEAITGVYT
jgi:HD-like signal output (HDOD) protein